MAGGVRDHRGGEASRGHRHRSLCGPFHSHRLSAGGTPGRDMAWNRSAGTYTHVGADPVRDRPRQHLQPVDTLFAADPPAGAAASLTRADYIERITAGRFPYALGLSERNRSRWFDAYVEQFVELDAPQVAGGSPNPHKIRAVLASCAARTGQDDDVGEGVPPWAIVRRPHRLRTQQTGNLPGRRRSRRDRRCASAATGRPPQPPTQHGPRRRDRRCASAATGRPVDHLPGAGLARQTPLQAHTLPEGTPHGSGPRRSPARHQRYSVDP